MFLQWGAEFLLQFSEHLDPFEISVDRHILGEMSEKDVDILNWIYKNVSELVVGLRATSE